MLDVDIWKAMMTSEVVVVSWEDDLASVASRDGEHETKGGQSLEKFEH